jgi:hypothetical protein
LELLQVDITAAWNSMLPDYNRLMCQRFRPCLEAVVAAQGGHIEA